MEMVLIFHDALNEGGFSEIATNIPKNISHCNILPLFRKILLLYFFIE